jgi:hypothetical protein
MLAVDRKHLYFKHPFTCITAGPTSSGKTVLIRRILKHHRVLINFKNEIIDKLSFMGLWSVAKPLRLYHQNLFFRRKTKICLLRKGISSILKNTIYIPSVKQYRKLLKKVNSPSDIEFQKIIDDYASKFDIKFCNGSLLKSGSINLALKRDHKYLNACPDYAHGITYSYPTKRRWSFMKRRFACFIEHNLSKPEMWDTMVDTVVHELIHAKIHMEKLSDSDDHGPKFLRSAIKAAKYFDIKMKINEHYKGGVVMTGNKDHNTKIINKVRSKINRLNKRTKKY